MKIRPEPHRARQVPLDRAFGEELKLNLSLPLPAALDILMAAQAVLAEPEGSRGRGVGQDGRGDK